MTLDALTARAADIAKGVADKCHGDRKPNAAQERYAIIYQAAMMGARSALSHPAPTNMQLAEAVREACAALVSKDAAMFRNLEQDARAHDLEFQAAALRALDLSTITASTTEGDGE